MTLRFARRPLLAALCLLAFPAAAAQAAPPVVLAAASLQESLNAAADAWAKHGHPRPVLSFAASSALARQVEAGAPADLFLSADQDWMDELAQKGLVRAGTRADFATNDIVLVAPAARPQHIALAKGPGTAKAMLAALGPAGRIATGQVASVPIGRYGKQALEQLGAWPAVADRVVGADSVRAALALVARGEAPLGIVYATDAKAEPKVMVAGRFPAWSHAPVRYPLAVTGKSASADAEGFRRFLLSGEARAIFRRFGFGAP